MKITSIKIGSKIKRRKYHKAKMTSVGFSLPNTMLQRPCTASIDVEIDDRRYHIVIEPTDFGVADLTDYLHDVVKNKPLK